MLYDCTIHLDLYCTLSYLLTKEHTVLFAATHVYPHMKCAISPLLYSPVTEH